MTPERYNALMADPNAQLSEQEAAEGWRFCMCEWDGLLIKAGDPETRVCSCWFNRDGTVKPDA